MASTSVRDNRQQHRAHGRDELCAGGQINIALLLNRILRAVAVGVIMRVVEKRIGGLITVKINNAEILALLDFMDPRLARRNYMAVARVSGIEFAFDKIRTSRCLV